MDKGREEKKQDSLSKLAGKVEEKTRRKIKAQQEGDRSVWYGIGMMGLVGWAVAIPTVLFVAIGIWIDNRWPGPVSWTLTLLIIGITLGCLNAWFWVKKESRGD
jgi:ATP synthase protein I